MTRPILIFVTSFSTVMLAVVVLLFLAGYVISPGHHYLSFSHDLHISVWNCGPDARLVFFNDADYGPYRGSIIGLVDADGNVHPPLVRERAFGDSWGIYYRDFQWSDSRLWTLMVTLWYPIVLFAILPAVRLLSFALARRATIAA
jgi:hypothetical protein